MKTADGYDLTIFRARDKSAVSGAPVVFLQHGIYSDGNFWALHYEQSLSVRLAKVGYDVWIGNNRGSRYCRTADGMDPVKDKAEFFDFSFYELGKYDAPAMIDYVIKQTGQPKVAFVGHSQGTTQMFSALAENHGNLNDKLWAFVGLAPIVNLQHTTNPALAWISKYWKTLTPVLRTLGMYEFADPAIDEDFKKLCRMKQFDPLCKGVE